MEKSIDYKRYKVFFEALIESLKKEFIQDSRMLDEHRAWFYSKNDIFTIEVLLFPSIKDDDIENVFWSVGLFFQIISNNNISKFKNDCCRLGEIIKRRVDAIFDLRPRVIYRESEKERDGFKIGDHPNINADEIVKKLAEKTKNKEEIYQKIYQEIHPFVEEAGQEVVIMMEEKKKELEEKLDKLLK